MEVAILTIGDEVLAGDIANTNAQWIASELTEQGATVSRILTVPDEHGLIATTVKEWADAFDAVIVSGGLGGTHDDVTVAALADAFDRDIVVQDPIREDVIETAIAYRDEHSESFENDDLDLDVDAWAALPAESRALINPEGLCPGCVVENVYVFPGVPSEMQALFEQVALEFSGDTVSSTLYTSEPEASITQPIAEVQERFDVTVGSYPATEGENRLRVSGTDAETVAEAVDWLCKQITIVSEKQ